MVFFSVTECWHEQSFGADEGHAGEASGAEPPRGHALVPWQDLQAGIRGPAFQGRACWGEVSVSIVVELRESFCEYGCEFEGSFLWVWMWNWGKVFVSMDAELRESFCEYGCEIEGRFLWVWMWNWGKVSVSMDVELRESFCEYRCEIEGKFLWV